MKSEKSATYGKKFEYNTLVIKTITKLGAIATIFVNTEELHLRKFFVVFHNTSNCDYHLITKELAKVFEGEFNCLQENTETNKTFSIQTTKEVKRIDMENKLQKPYFTNVNLLMAQGLW